MEKQEQEQFQFIRQHLMYSTIQNMQHRDLVLVILEIYMDVLLIQLRMFWKKELQLLKAVQQHLHLHLVQLQLIIQFRHLLLTVDIQLHRKQYMEEATTFQSIHLHIMESEQHLLMHMILQRLRMLQKKIQEQSILRLLVILTVIFLILKRQQKLLISMDFHSLLIIHLEHLILLDQLNMVLILQFILQQSSLADMVQHLVV